MDCCVRFAVSVVSRTLAGLCIEGCLSLKAETGTLIFGVISALLTGIMSVFCFVCLFFLDWIDWVGEEFVIGHHKYIITAKFVIVMNIVLGLVATKLLIDFIFAVILCDGVCKKKAGYLKAYFIYGLVMVAIKVLIVLVAFCMLDWQCGFTVLSVLGIYCSILRMVKIAHGRMLTGEVYQFQHKRLEETVY